MNKLFYAILVMFILVGSISLASAVINPIIYYNFDETSGNLIDQVASNNAIASGSPTYARNGVINNSIKVTTTGDWFNVTDPSIFGGINNASFSMWVNFSDFVTQNYFWNGNLGGDDDSGWRLAGISNELGILITGTGVGNNCGVGTGTNSINANQWYHLGITFDDGEMKVYINGVLNSTTACGFTTIDVVDEIRFGDSGTHAPNMIFDEFGFWDKTLSQTEITDLYNGGSGLAFPFADILVVLNSPEDNFITTQQSINFNSTLLPKTNFNLTNATLNIWYLNSSLFNGTTNIITGNTTNTTSWNISNIPFDTFNWNVFGCIFNSTGGDTSCGYANNNFTFTVQKFDVLNQSFNNNVFETDREEFEIDINTISVITSVDANLIYNGTSHSASTSCDESGFCNIRASIDIPLVVGTDESQNKSFFWNIIVFNSVSFVSVNTSENQQNTSRIHLEECGGAITVQSLNFTAFDEQNSTRIDPFSFDGTFNTWLGNGDIKRNNSFSNANTAEIDLCISPPERNFFTDATIEYNDLANSTLYQTRNYFFQNDTINNATQHIPLHLLLSSVATSFILKVQDNNLLPLDDVLVFSQRFDAGTGNFTTVQVAKTSDTGQSVGFFETETVDYRFLIKRNGLLLLQTSPQKIVGETAPFTLTFTIGEGASKPWELFEDLPNLDATLTFNKSSNNVVFSYVDTSGTFTLARLLVETQNFSTFGAVICDNNSSQASGILTCDVGNATGNYIARGFIIRDGSTNLVRLINFGVEIFTVVVGMLGVFLGWFIILISAFAFKFNELAGIWLINAAVIFVNMIQLVSFGFIFIFSMIGVSIMITIMFNKS